MKLENVIVKRTGKTIYRDGNKVIKLFDSQYSMADILNEALNQARVMETGLNIPKLHGITEIDGKTAIVLDYIEDKTFEQIMLFRSSAQKSYLQYNQVQLQSFHQFRLLRVT